MSPDRSFQPYLDHSPKVPVTRITPDNTPSIHRFYDTSPISPSGRYLAYTEFRDDTHLPEPGEQAFVVVIDLLSGAEVHRSATIAWDSQVGAHPQWGASDAQLFFNTMDPQDWQPRGVKIDISTGRSMTLQGPVYMVSPDGDYVISPDLVRIWEVQPGYGVNVPEDRRPSRPGAPDDEGVLLTDTRTGECRLLVSLQDIHDRFPSQFHGLDLSRGSLYGFHTKWSPDGKRIMFLIRWREKQTRGNKTSNWIFTMNADGTDLRLALTPRQWAGGHHPNWCPDSDTIVMNLIDRTSPKPGARLAHSWQRIARKLKIRSSGVSSLRFMTFRFDGSEMKVIAPSQVGSGHPTWHAGLRAILTDAYPHEPVAYGDGTVPIRLISSETDSSEVLIRIRTKPDFEGPRREWRVDPHPAWNLAGNMFAFNACPNGVRGVFIADLRDLVSEVSS